jgi:hypothetical protein
MPGPAVPDVLLNALGQGLSEKLENRFLEAPKRSIQVFLNGRYNSRFLAFESWWRTPLQLNKLWHVIRPGTRPHPDLFVYRQPFLSFAPEVAFDGFPEAKLIYIYRDGRDVANSLVETYDAFSDHDLSNFLSPHARLGRQHDDLFVPWWVEEGREQEFVLGSQYVRAIWLWSYIVNRCESFLSERMQYSKERILKIRYEDLVSDPQLWGAKICEHLDKEMTVAFRRKLSEARTSSIGKYQQRSQEEVEEAMGFAAEELERLGYV